jgi:hypothetical protein
MQSPLKKIYMLCQSLYVCDAMHMQAYTKTVYFIHLFKSRHGVLFESEAGRRVVLTLLLFWSRDEDHFIFISAH